MNNLAKMIRADKKAFKFNNFFPTRPEPADVFLKENMYASFSGKTKMSSLPGGARRKRMARTIPGRASK